jgi:hypothetical protein
MAAAGSVMAVRVAHLPPKLGDSRVRLHARAGAPKAAISEDELQADVAQYLDIALMPGSCWYPVPNGGKRTKVTARLMKRNSLVRAGVPDIAIINNRLSYHIELKTRARRSALEASQKAMIERLALAGSPTLVCTDPYQVEAALRSWNIGVRGSLDALCPILKAKYARVRP